MGNKLMLYLVVAIALFTAVHAIAAPTVNNISGTISHGQTVSISGAAFGTKSTAVPQLWDTVDNKYTGLSHGATIPIGKNANCITGTCPWDSNGSGQNLTKYWTAEQRHSRSTAIYHAQTTTNTWEAGMAGHTLTGATQIYLAWWTKIEPNINGGGGGNSSKILRLSGSAYHGDPGRQTLSWDPNSGAGGVYAYDNQYCQTYLDSGPDTGDGNWHFIEIWANQNSKFIKVAVDGADKPTLSTATCGAWNWDYIWKIGAERGGTSPPLFELWMDDIYADSTPARVTVCSGSTWSSRSKCEIQIPSAWSDSSITATVNQGAFADGSTAYLYVIDSTGAVNSGGIPVTFGATEADTTPPVISGGSPSGTLAAGTTQVTVSFATNEAAICRWSDFQNTPYASMTNTFPTTGGTSHSGNEPGLTDGRAYALYVRCMDSAGNATTGDYPIAWAIASGATASGKINASGKFQFH